MARAARCQFLSLLAAPIVVVCLLGCGGAGTPTHSAPAIPRQHPIGAASSCNLPEAQGVMGRCAPVMRTTLVPSQQPRLGTSAVIPDVSEWNGYPCWPCAGPHIVAAVVRVQDNHWADTHFAYNVTHLRGARVRFAVYAFLRPAPDCSAEADAALERMRLASATDALLIADAEVPLPYWCVQQFNAAVERRTHRPSVDYTSAGTYYGGPHGKARLWLAAYGPARTCVPTWPCVNGQGVSVAWQHTDGEVGPYPRFVAGIGYGDLSRDEGLAALMSPPLPPSKLELKRRLYYHYQQRSRLRGELALEEAKIHYYHRLGVY
jgi:hypothetical protein